MAFESSAAFALSAASAGVMMKGTMSNAVALASRSVLKGAVGCLLKGALRYVG
jgi:hypothetical protein